MVGPITIRRSLYLYRYAHRMGSRGFAASIGFSLPSIAHTARFGEGVVADAERYLPAGEGASLRLASNRLCRPTLRIKATGADQFLVPARFNDPSLGHDMNHVGEHGRCEPVRD